MATFGGDYGVRRQIFRTVATDQERVGLIWSKLTLLRWYCRRRCSMVRHLMCANWLIWCCPPLASTNCIR